MRSFSSQAGRQAGRKAGWLAVGWDVARASGQILLVSKLFILSLSLSQRHPKLPVSLQNVQTEDLHGQPAGRDQRPLGSLLHPALPEGVRSPPWPTTT